MNTLIILQAAMESIKRAMGLSDLRYAARNSTPGLPRRHPSHQTRAKAPNDGRWHMKHHRSR